MIRTGGQWAKSGGAAGELRGDWTVSWWCCIGGIISAGAMQVPCLCVAPVRQHTCMHPHRLLSGHTRSSALDGLCSRRCPPDTAATQPGYLLEAARALPLRPTLSSTHFPSFLSCMISFQSAFLCPVRLVSLEPSSLAVGIPDGRCQFSRFHLVLCKYPTLCVRFVLFAVFVCAYVSGTNATETRCSCSQ